MARLLKLIQLPLFLSLAPMLLLLVASTAQATSSAPPAACAASDCEYPGLIITEGEPEGFDVGIKVIEDGLSLRIRATGNVFILGPVNATGSVSFLSPGVEIGGEVGGEKVSVPSDVTVSAVAARGAISAKGASASVLSMTRDLLLAKSADVQRNRGALGKDLVSAVLSMENPDRKPGKGHSGGHGGGGGGSPWITLSFEGDVYLDVSMVTMANLKVKADGNIKVVPEPGSALLLGLGLGGLAWGGRRREA